MQPAFAAYLAGDKATAIDTFLAGVYGPEYPALVDRVLPSGAREQAARDADTLFAVEAPSVGRWGFDPGWLATLTQPILSVLGARSDEVSRVSSEAHALLLDQVPNVEAYLLPRHPLSPAAECHRSRRRTRRVLRPASPLITGPRSCPRVVPSPWRCAAIVTPDAPCERQLTKPCTRSSSQSSTSPSSA